MPLIASLHCQRILGWPQATLLITCAQVRYCGKDASSRRFPEGHGSQGMSLSKSADVSYKDSGNVAFQQ